MSVKRKVINYRAFWSTSNNDGVILLEFGPGDDKGLEFDNSSDFNAVLAILEREEVHFHSDGQIEHRGTPPGS